MNWQQVCEHPSLQDLPFKIELDSFGKIIMSPTRVFHGIYQARIGHLLTLLLGGTVITECAIQTAFGTKVADVAWASAERAAEIGDVFDCPIAPEICVEILSPGNTHEEMMAKMLTYNLDFNKSKSLFYLSKNLISEHEDQERKKYVTALFYGYDKIYIDKKEDKLIEELYYSYQNLLKVRKANFINWELTKETKEIKGYKCFKATYTYIQKWRGREFPWEIIAWYSTEIPVKLGPIRYGGLPGLILELSEDNRGFIVDEIKFLNDEELEIKEPTKGELILEDEIK